MFMPQPIVVCYLLLGIIHIMDTGLKGVSAGVVPLFTFSPRNPHTPKPNPGTVYVAVPESQEYQRPKETGKGGQK